MSREKPIRREEKGSDTKAGNPQSISFFLCSAELVCEPRISCFGTPATLDPAPEHIVSNTLCWAPGIHCIHFGDIVAERLCLHAYLLPPGGRGKSTTPPSLPPPNPTIPPTPNPIPMEGTLLLSWACIVFTVWMFATGLSDLWSMVTLRSVGNIQFLPYVTTALNNLGWFYYGQLKNDWTLMAVNSIGFSLQSCYIMAYLYFTSEKSRPVLKLGMAACALAAGYLYLTTVPESDRRMDQLGLVCSSFTVSMYLSPLADLVKIIRSRSTKCLSFSLTVATLLTSASWTLYGLDRSDLYIVIPNMPGIVTSLIRFWLFWNYPATDEKYSYRPLLA